MEVKEHMPTQTMHLTQTQMSKSFTSANAEGMLQSSTALHQTSAINNKKDINFLEWTLKIWLESGKLDKHPHNIRRFEFDGIVKTRIWGLLDPNFDKSQLN